MKTLFRLRDHTGRTHCTLQRLCQGVLVRQVVFPCCRTCRNPKPTPKANECGRIGGARRFPQCFNCVYPCMMHARTTLASLSRGLDGLDSTGDLSALRSSQQRIQPRRRRHRRSSTCSPSVQNQGDRGYRGLLRRNKFASSAAVSWTVEL